MTAGTQTLPAPITSGLSGRVDHGNQAADRAVAIAAGKPERKAMQRCWICEQRRTCTRIAGRWECLVCEAIS